jgi:D-3-phosphoglycerate dehydrogenase
VVRSDLWLNPVFDARLAQEQDISLGVFPVRGNPAAAWDMLAGAHVYHMSAAKDELPQEYFATERADRALPAPVVRVLQRRGLRHGGRGRLHGRRRGGRQPGRRERRLGRGTHAGLMLAVSRRMIEGDRRMRREIGLRPRGRDGPRDPRPHRGPGRHRPHRHARGAAGARVRHGGDRHRSVPARPTRSSGVAPGRRRSQVLEQADFVSLHCPRDKSTLKMMNADAFAA